MTTDLTGLWHALWQTTADGRPSIDSEEVAIEEGLLPGEWWLRNLAMAPENPLGGYLWTGSLVPGRTPGHFYGHYSARDPEALWHGVLYLVADHTWTRLTGRWTGRNLDSMTATGAAVLARDPQVARAEMARLTADATRKETR